MSELSRRHVCRLSSFALVSFFVAPQSNAWGIQGSVGSPQQIDGCTVAPLREAWLPTNGADNVILWFQLLPFSGPLCWGACASVGRTDGESRRAILV